MPFLAKVGRESHLGFVAPAWAVFFALAAWVLPPLDSHQRPVPLVYWSVLILAILLVVPTVIVVPAYVYRSWLKLPTVPNRMAYGLWVGLESLLLLGVPMGLAFWVVDQVTRGSFSFSR